MYFEAKVGYEAVKANQNDFKTTSGQTKTNGDNVVEDKGGENIEINGHKKIRGSYTNRSIGGT